MATAEDIAKILHDVSVVEPTDYFLILPMLNAIQSLKCIEFATDTGYRYTTSNLAIN